MANEEIEVRREEASTQEDRSQRPTKSKGVEDNVGDGSAAAASSEGRVDTQAHDLRFALDKSIRYHQRRRAHYDRIHRFLMFLIIVSGSVSFASVTAPIVSPAWFAAIAAVVAASDLVWNFSHRARDHEMLVRDFTELAVALNEAEVTQAAIAACVRRRMGIEAREPPTFWAVEADCYNEVVRARGSNPDYLCTIPRRHRWLMHWLRFERYSYFRPADVRKPDQPHLAKN